MSTNRMFIRIGDHVINLARVVHIAFDIEPWAGNKGGGKCAFIYFEITRYGVQWDLVLTGEDALALEAYFGQEEEGDDNQWE